jgi:hypothetical protein
MTMSVFSVLLAFVVFSCDPSDAVVTTRLQVQVSARFSCSRTSIAVARGAVLAASDLSHLFRNASLVLADSKVAEQAKRVRS